MSAITPIPKEAKIYIAGHRGLVGSALYGHLSSLGFTNLIGWTSAELDLREEVATRDAIRGAKPDVIIMAAARVGGIMANSTYPVEFLNDNLRVQTNIFEAAHAADVPRLLFLGSSCIYPKMAPQPISEESLLTGPLEETNQAYAIAKITGVLQVQSYRREYGRAWISAMPTNLYGPGDSFDPETSHVLPALMRRFHEAKMSDLSSVTIWGTGSPLREFLHSDDLASACLHLLENYDQPEPINIGWGKDISIHDLALLIARVVGFQGEINWDPSKPDGSPRKLLDTRKLNSIGWEPKISLQEGILSTYAWYRENAHSSSG